MKKVQITFDETTMTVTAINEQKEGTIKANYKLTIAKHEDDGLKYGRYNLYEAYVTTADGKKYYGAQRYNRWQWWVVDGETVKDEREARFLTNLIVLRNAKNIDPMENKLIRMGVLDPKRPYRSDYWD